MPKKSLSDHFIPEKYTLKVAAMPDEIALAIQGRRVGKPSKRLTLHQQNLKIKSANITSESKNKAIEYEIVRINHLPSFQEVRLHTKNLQYPGEYKVQMIFSGRDLAEIKEVFKDGNVPSHLRQYMPSLDEPDALEKISIEVN